MFVTGAGSISELVGDLVAYRSLRPCDKRLTDFAVPPLPPRKIQPEYARIVGELLQSARRLDAPHATLRRLIVVGDSTASDATAWANLCAEWGWTGSAVIVDEQSEVAESAHQHIDSPDRRQVLLTRWADLREWAHTVAAAGVDEETAILLDIDKTLLGARGRNDGVIDHARGRAMHRAVAEALQARFDAQAFEHARHLFNMREFQAFTGDNQDYVAYLALVVAGGLFQPEEMAALIRGGQISDVQGLVQRVELELQDRPTDLAAGAAHRSIAERIRAGDPTPFKAFRQIEYEETLACMGRSNEMSIDTRLREELVLTGEVVDLARHWKSQGAMLFALSDKPDEAAIPNEELQQAGYLPLHHVRTHIVDSQP